MAHFSSGRLLLKSGESIWEWRQLGVCTPTANPIWPTLPLLLLFGPLELWAESFDLSLIAFSVLIEMWSC